MIGDWEQGPARTWHLLDEATVLLGPGEHLDVAVRQIEDDYQRVSV